MKSKLSYLDFFQSPLGEIEIRASDDGVSHVFFTDCNKHYAHANSPELLNSPELKNSPEPVNSPELSSSPRVKNSKTPEKNHLTALCKQQLNAYFSGDLNTFDIPLDMQGTPFQKSVWQQLTRIEFGASCSYLDVARAINKPKAVRAVGAANGKNPVSIIVPCHRVIGKSGKLTGYAGGIERKQWLLQHEAT